MEMKSWRGGSIPREIERRKEELNKLAGNIYPRWAIRVIVP